MKSPEEHVLTPWTEKAFPPAPKSTPENEYMEGTSYSAGELNFNPYFPSLKALGMLDDE
jgi:hypothetical protein